MARRNYTNTAATATVPAFIDATVTSLTLTNFSGFPPVPFTASIDRGTADEEIVLVTAVALQTLTVTRGYDGTTAKSHTGGAKFEHVAIAKDFDEASAHVNATSGVHGTTGAVADKPYVDAGDAALNTRVTANEGVLTAATPAATPSTLVKRDATGWFGAVGIYGLGTPVAATDAVNKGYVDAVGTRVTAAEGTLSAATATATVSTLAKRDAAGRLAVVSGSAAGDAVNKGQLDALAPSAWTAITPGNNFGQFTDATYAGGLAWRINNGWVELRGWLTTTGITAANAAINPAALPVAARIVGGNWPLYIPLIGTESNGSAPTQGFARLVCRPDGLLCVAASLNSGVSINLHGLRYPLVA